MPDIFLSHATTDKAKAEAFKVALDAAGHRVFLDSAMMDGIEPGAAWQETLFSEIRVADAVLFLNSAASQRSQWCHTELAYALQLSKTVYPVDVERSLRPHPLVTHLQKIRFSDASDVTLEALLEAIARKTTDEHLAWDRRRPPYPGLAAFEIADASVFFGRNSDVRRLVDRVDSPLAPHSGRLIVVAGASGSGKSSLLKAGLAARLATRRDGWFVAPPFEPGASPLDSLARSLAALGGGDLDTAACRDILLRDGLAAVADRFAVSPRDGVLRRVLLPLDQLEQLLLNSEVAEREPFLDVLESGLAAGSLVTIVATIRADRLEALQQVRVFDSMGEAMLLAPLARKDLADAIVGPARRADLTLADGVVARLLDEATAGSRSATVDALPMVASALRELYELARSEGRRAIRPVDIDAIGGLSGSIERRAMQAESALPRSLRDRVKPVLARLVQITSEQEAPSSLPVANVEFDGADAALVRHFVDQRLLTDSNGQIRLVHEQLLSSWPTLRDLLVEQRADLVLRTQLERQARDWIAGRTELLSRDATTEARQWLLRSETTRSAWPTVAGFVQKSRQRHRNRRALLVLSTVFILALTLAATSFGFASARSAREATRRADEQASARLSALATDQARSDPEVAALLAAAAYKKRPSPGSRGALAAAAEALGDQPRTLTATDVVQGVAFAPDGRTFATTGSDGTVRIWDTATGATIRSLTGHTGEAVRVAFAPDGKILAATGSDGTVRIWEAATGATIRSLTGNAGPLFGVAFAPDGRTLAAARSDGIVRIYDAATGATIRSLAGHGGAVLGVAFAPDGRTLATTSSDRTVRIWDPDTGMTIRSLNGHGGAVLAVAFAPDGNALATTSVDRTVRIWDAASGDTLGVLTGHSDVVTDVAFAPDGKTLATTSVDRTVRIWDATTGTSIRNLSGHTGTVFGLAFTPDGKTLATASADRTVRLWAVASTNETVRTLIGHADTVEGVAFAPDGKTLATASFDGTVRIWDVSTGETVRILSPHAGIVEGVAFSPSGGTLATTNQDGTVRIWDTATGDVVRVLTGHTDSVKGVAFAPDGRTLATGGVDRTVRIWDAATGVAIRVLTGHASAVYGVTFAPDGETLVTTSFDRTARLWDVATGETARILAGHSGAVEAAAFAPDGKSVATASVDRTVRIWDVASGDTVRTLTGHSDSVVGVVIAPDGKTLATTSGDRTVRIWDTATGTTIRTLTGHAGSVLGVSFGPDGRTLATTSDDGTVRIWPCWACRSGDALLQVVSSLVPRELTLEERRRFGL